MYKWENIGFVSVSLVDKDIEIKDDIIITHKKENLKLSFETNFGRVNIEGKEDLYYIGTIVDLPEEDMAGELEEVGIVYARCENSMKLLDPYIRQHILDIDYEKNMTYALKAVAGSGKTTTLLNVANENKSKKICYLAFNKAIVEEIKKKCKQTATNIKPYTFDALVRKCFITNRDKHKQLHEKMECSDISIIDLNPYTFADMYPWFKNKPFKMKRRYISNYNNFCKNTDINNIHDYIQLFMSSASSFEKKTLTEMWTDTLNYKIITFPSMRKMCLIKKWFTSLDQTFDMFMIDEAQDFDKLMLKMLLQDTTSPKLFVGDTNQAIYEWRGAINAFEMLPEDTHFMEIYKTWRIGNPACRIINNMFSNCWMTAGNESECHFHLGEIPNENYDYLYRTWRNILLTASKCDNIWINDFKKKEKSIIKLHEKIKKFGFRDDDEEELEDDDLPVFLTKLSQYELIELMENINKNLVPKEKAHTRLYTIHSYKGMENNIIRIGDDIDIKNELNLHYVALTRAKQKIYVDDRKTCEHILSIKYFK